jgi:hypothetical protein
MFFGKVFHDWLGLDVQVPHHFIVAPATEERDDIFVDISTQECHGAAGTKGAGANVVWKETECRSKGGNREPKGHGHVLGSNRAKFVGLVIGGEWGGEIVSV